MKKIIYSFSFLILMLGFILSIPIFADASSEVRASNVPSNLPQKYLSSDFDVSIAGMEAGVYNAGQNAWGQNVSFCPLEFQDRATITVTVDFPFSNVRILPRQAGINCTRSGNSISFTLSEAQNVTLLFDENFQGKVLHIFAQKPETDIPDFADEDVIYFGPGFYDYADGTPLILESGKTLYLASGAVLRGRVVILNASDVTICGRGILLNDFTTNDGYDSVALAIKNSTDVTLKDIIISRNAASWSAFMWKCSNVNAENMKIINPCYACSDGFDIANSHDIRFEHMFIRSCDDSIAIKGTGTNGYNAAENPADTLPNYNILIQNSQVWSDTNNALGIGQETSAAYYAHITFKNIDILYNYDDYNYPDQLKERSAINIGVLNATNISDITFEDIRVEQAKRLISITMADDFWFGTLPGNWAWEGNVSGITYRNITSYSSGNNEIQIFGHDANHIASNIVFEDIQINGQQMTSFDDSRFKVNSFAENLSIKNDGNVLAVKNGPFGSNVHNIADEYSQIQGGNGWHYRTWTAGVGNADMIWNSDGSYHWRGSHNYDAIWLYDGILYMHPDNDQTMLEWTANEAGTVCINSNVRKYDAGGGDGVVASIWKNSELVWPQNGWLNIAYNDTVGVNHTFWIDVSAGDVISFRVDEGSENSYDTTIWEASILYDSYE